MNTGTIQKIATVSLLLVALAPVGHLLAQAGTFPAEILAYPDIILYNGQLLTADDDFTIAEAVALRGKIFMAVGSNTEVLRLAGPQTQRIDLRGRSVVPGLFDTHLHQAWVAQLAKSGSSGRASFKDRVSGLGEVQTIVSKATPGEWLYIGGPDNKALVTDLTLEELDRVSPANPVVITTTNNLGFANSLALKSVDWEIGGVEKDPGTGQPTGIVSGFALGALTYERMPIPPLAEGALELQQEIFRKLNSQGLTTIIGRAQGTSISVLKELWAQEKLTARVRVCHEFVRQNAQAENYLKRIGNLSGFGDPWMKIIGLTVQPVDGTSNAGAVLTAMPKQRELPDSPFGKYGQNKYENYGSTLEKSEYHNIILANRYGWNIACVHSQGDGAADMLLKAFAEANQEKPLEGTWAFDHALSRTPENIARAKELGVIFSVAPKYLFIDTPTRLVFQFGEGVHRMTPVRDMIQAGMKPVLEADVRGKYSAPLWTMEVLITRTDEDGKMWGHGQRITREEALWMKTNWASHYSGDEKLLGTIEPGKLADLVVLGGDYMSVPEDQIAELSIDLTVVDGRIVYDREKEGEVHLDYWDR